MQLFQKIEEEVILSNSFYEDSIFILKLEEDATRTDTDECPSLYINAKNLNKTSINWMKQYIKRIIIPQD